MYVIGLLIKASTFALTKRNNMSAVLFADHTAQRKR